MTLMMLPNRIVILAACLAPLLGCKNNDGPPTGAERGPCYPNLTCNAGLTCLSGLCVRLIDAGIEAGTDGPARDGDPTRDAPPPFDAPGPGQVTTLAGTGNAGATDGPGAVAELNYPTGVALSPAGDLLYVADRDNHTIRAITIATGEVTTLAGSGAQGYLDGAGTAAQLNTPTGLAVDAQGVIYVADTGNHRIRKIDAGQVSTFAGTGVPGATMGPPLSASFNSPRGVTVDPWGVVYVTDYFGVALRKITTTVNSISNYIYGGVGLASDGQGTIFIAEQGQHQISQYATSITTFAGSTVAGETDGDALFAKFKSPAGVTVTGNGETVYIADTGNHRIRRVRAGQVSTLCGSSAGFLDGKLADARFNGPYGIALDSSGRLYVADTNNHRIRMIVP